MRGDLDLTGATEGLRDPGQWHTFVDALFDTDWIVYAKPAFGGASAVLRYLGRYTHRVAISNHRLMAFDGEHVTFQWKDYAHGNQWRTMTLTAMEFLSRFVQHVLPRGFVRIRQNGYLASTCRTAQLAFARRLISRSSRPAAMSATTPGWHCPRCGMAMVIGRSSRRAGSRLSRQRSRGRAHLRRTCVRLCHLAGGELDQIQFLQGYGSIQTTDSAVDRNNVPIYCPGQIRSPG